MYIVQETKTKSFFKKGIKRIWWDSKLVKRLQATVFKSKNEIIKLLGRSKTWKIIER